MASVMPFRNMEQPARVFEHPDRLKDARARATEGRARFQQKRLGRDSRFSTGEKTRKRRNERARRRRARKMAENPNRAATIELPPEEKERAKGITSV